MFQEIREIGGVNVPVVVDNGVTYYPISYLSEKVLLRKSSIISTKSNSLANKDMIKMFTVDFSLSGGGNQFCKCISEDELKNIIQKFKTGRLDSKQKRRINMLNKYLNIADRVPEGERFLDKLPESKMLKYNIFIQDAINEVLNDHLGKFQSCSKCGNIYPLHKKFFKENRSSPYKFNTYCKNCGRDSDFRILVNDSYKSNMYYKHGLEFYKFLRDHDTINIYKYYIEKNMSHFPHTLYNKKDILKIIKYLCDSDMINKDDITLSMFVEKFRIPQIYSHITLHDIYSHLFESEYYLRPWEHQNFKFSKQTIRLTDEIAIKVFNNFLEKEHIIIDNIYNFDYETVMRRCGIMNRYEDSPLRFIVKYNKCKVAGYKFKKGSINYYKEKEFRVLDMKYLIEQDLKLELEKLPLYLTQTKLKNTSNTMHNLLKKYYKNLFHWIDEVYPNKFIESDFRINIVRDRFDSIEELEVHGILCNHFDNVIYNKRNEDETIIFDGLVPDWIILEETKPMIVEYFGMYTEGTTSRRVMEYVERTKKKIAYFDKLNNYAKLYIYPYDLKNEYQGLKIKIKEINHII